MDDAKLAAIVDASSVGELQEPPGAVKTQRLWTAAASCSRFDNSYHPPSAVPVKPRTATSTANLSIDLPTRLWMNIVTRRASKIQKMPMVCAP